MSDDAKSDYANHLKTCSRFDAWRLKTACSLITGGLPEYANAPHPEPMRYAAVYEAALSCASQSLPLVDEEAAPADYRVFPKPFSQWAAGIGFTLYEDFSPQFDASVLHSRWEKAEDLAEIKTLFFEATGQKLPSSIAAKLRAYDDRVQAKWRCRGLAAYLWSQDPSRTTTDVASDPILKQAGCEGRRYSARQMGDWIANLNPAPKVGRPCKKT